MTNSQTQLLDAAFGPGAPNASAEQRATASTRMFVRSLQQIAEDSASARGRRLTAYEALSAYGWDTLAEVAAEGAALLGRGQRDAARTLQLRQADLGMGTRDLANLSGLPLAEVEEALHGDAVAARTYELLGTVLALDERMLGVRVEPQGNEALTVRLRTIGPTQPRMTPSVVGAIAEAAWIASTQVRLERAMGRGPADVGIAPSDQYGGPGYPAYLHGYYLAEHARERLTLGTGPIASLRELCEERLGIPLVFANLGARIAGLTIELDGARAIVLNSGEQYPILVRRVTVAHELGHLLFDPPARLDTLRVDGPEELEDAPERVRDPVEQRANAFAVEFLAPQAAALQAFNDAGGTPQDGTAAVVARFGISPAAAAYQVWNGLERRVPLADLRPPRHQVADSLQDWLIKEEYTGAFHPIRTLRPSRRGRFSAVVVRAAIQSVISWDTAALYLDTDPGQAKKAEGDLRDLFPSTFAA